MANVKQSCNHHCNHDVDYFHHTKSFPTFALCFSVSTKKFAWIFVWGKFIHSTENLRNNSHLHGTLFASLSLFIFLLSFFTVMLCNFQYMCFNTIFMRLFSSSVFHAIVNGIAFLNFKDQMLYKLLACKYYTIDFLCTDLLFYNLCQIHLRVLVVFWRQLGILYMEIHCHILIKKVLLIIFHLSPFHWSRCIILLKCFWIQSIKDLLKILHLCSRRIKICFF